MSRATEGAERFARAAPQSEIREEAPRFGKPRDHRRARDESRERELEGEASFETHDHRIEKRREIRANHREVDRPRADLRDRSTGRGAQRDARSESFPSRSTETPRVPLTMTTVTRSLEKALAFVSVSRTQLPSSADCLEK